MAFNKENSRPTVRYFTTKTVTELIKHHLARHGKTIAGDLAQWWGMHGNSVHRRLHGNASPLPPNMIDRFVVSCGLTEDEALELHRLAAQEYGFRIDKPSKSGVVDEDE